MKLNLVANSISFGPLRACLVVSMRCAVMGACFLSLGVAPTTVTAKQPLRVALNDMPGIGLLPVMLGLEHARLRDLDLEVSYLHSESLVIQAVKANIVDIGMGTPYRQIQRDDLPLRMFYQLSKLAFSAMVNTEHYRTWGDLNGIDMYVHGSGSGTEAVMNFMASLHGIRYSGMHYLPGSGVRAQAMLEGRINATVLDAERRLLLLENGNGRFAALPTDGVAATDEALFATETTLRTHATQIRSLVEAFRFVWRNINDDPDYVRKERERFNLIPDLRADEVVQITPLIREIVRLRAIPVNGGDAAAVRKDFEFYSKSGTLSGTAEALNVSDFWNLQPLSDARPDVALQ